VGFGFYGRHEVVAPAAVTSATVSVAFALPPAEAGFSLAVPVAGVLSEPPLDGAVLLSDGLGLEVSEGDGVDDDVVVLGLVVVGAGLELMDGADDAAPVLYGVAVRLHDGEGFGELDAEERGDRDA
jgi:hypothetical protein